MLFGNKLGNKFAFVFALLLALIAVPVLSAPTPHSDAQRVYSLAVVPQFEVRRLHKVWLPIIDELHRRTGYNFKLVGAPDIPAFEKGFAAQHYDFAYMNPYHAVKAMPRGYRPLVNDSSRQLFGILVVDVDSDIQSAADLDGTTIAFPAPNALGASLMTRAVLSNDFNISYTPVYAKTHSSCYFNVIMGHAAAAGGVMSTLRRQPPEVLSQLRVLYETERVPPHPLMVHNAVPESVAMAVQRAFIDMGSTEEGLALLKGVPMGGVRIATVEDFEVLTGMGLEAFYHQ